jgi:hypothetical protein
MNEKDNIRIALAALFMHARMNKDAVPVISIDDAKCVDHLRSKLVASSLCDADELLKQAMEAT